MKRLAFICFSLYVFFTGCNTDLEGLEPQYVIPLVKGTAKIEDVSDLRDRQFVQDIPPFDIGVTPFVPITLPALEIDYIGPYSHTISEYFKYVLVDTAELQIDYQNNFPLTIKEGTKIVFRSEPNVNNEENIIYSHAITTDIAPYGDYSIDLLITDTYIPDTIHIYLEDFTTEEGENLYFTDHPTEITFDLKFLSINRIGIHTNREYTFSDTASIVMGEDVDSYDDSTATGIIHFYLENTIPVNVEFTPYFMDAHYQLIDSLYDGVLAVEGGIVNPIGLPLEMKEMKYSVTLTPERIKNLRNAEFMIYKFHANTYDYPGEIVVGGRDCKFTIQATGDLTIRIVKLTRL